MTYLEVKQYKTAQKILEKLPNGANPELYDAIIWYKALLYQKNKEPKKAIELLEELSTTTNEFTESSKDLLIQLQEKASN